MPSVEPGLVRLLLGHGARLGVGGVGGASGLDFGQPEVENLGVSAIGDEDVGGLDVAVDDSFAVRSVERIRHFDG